MSTSRPNNYRNTVNISNNLSSWKSLIINFDQIENLFMSGLLMAAVAASHDECLLNHILRYYWNKLSCRATCIMCIFVYCTLPWCIPNGKQFGVLQLVYFYRCSPLLRLNFRWEQSNQVAVVVVRVSPTFLMYKWIQLIRACNWIMILTSVIISHYKLHVGNNIN